MYCVCREFPSWTVTTSSTSPGIAICIHDGAQENRMVQLPSFGCKNTAPGAASLR